MSKVLLLAPPARKLATDSKEFAPPIGLTYLAASLQEQGHEVRILDCIAERPDYEKLSFEDNGVFVTYGLSDLEIGHRIHEFNPDIIGISNNFTAQAGEAMYLARIAKSVLPKSTVVVGGAHATMAAEEMLRSNDSIDCIVVGEGEVALTELVGGKSLEDIAGLVYRDNGAVRQNPRSFIRDLNKLQLPALDLLNLEAYTQDVSQFYAYGKSRERLWQSLSFSRGCPGGCDFCLAEEMEGKKIRSLSLENIGNILVQLKEYGITDITIEDNNFLRNPNFFGITGLLKKHDFVYNVINGVDPSYLSEHPELISDLKDTGCYRVFYPIESANPAALQGVHKYAGDRGVDRYNKIRENNKRNIKRLTDAGIEVAAAYMIGFPDETKRDIKRTGRLAKEIFKINPDMISTYVYCVTPFPGSKLYKRCAEEGRLRKDRVDWQQDPELYTYDHAQIGTDPKYLHMVEQQRLKIMKQANREEVAEFLVGGKSWKNYGLLKNARAVA